MAFQDSSLPGSDAGPRAAITTAGEQAAWLPLVVPQSEPAAWDSLPTVVGREVGENAQVLNEQEMTLYIRQNKF